MKFSCIALFVMLNLILSNCNSHPKQTGTKYSEAKVNTVEKNNQQKFSRNDSTIYPGAYQIDQYIDSIKNKKIVIVANATSRIGSQYLVDSLTKHGIDIKIIFAPEHGFRGEADAGEELKNYTDTKTGLPVFSLYGESKKPTKESLKNIDIILFDIQDVGVRFYTYISTLHYVMEAAAENKIKVIVLDRPNPNGFYVDGPVLEKNEKSFVGMHPVPIVFGMTIGEYAMMINGEGWLKNGIKCNLQVVNCKNYNHKSIYNLPAKPSPNLRDNKSIYLYPSLCLFEGTVVSVGRGTDHPFKVIGYPGFSDKNFFFVPASIEGANKPLYNQQKCFGIDLTKIDENELINFPKFNLKWIQLMYEDATDKENFFLKGNFFNKLAGNHLLMQQIKDGISEDKIREIWQKDLEVFKITRKKYLLYPDFEK